MLLRRENSVSMRILIVLALIVTLVVPFAVAKPASAVASAELALDLDMTAGYQGLHTKTVTAGTAPTGNFSLEVFVIAGGGQLVTTVDIFLDFNKDEIELKGIAADTTTLNGTSFNKGDSAGELTTANTLGNADVGVYRTNTQDDNITGTFRVATMTFHRKAGSGSTNISFHDVIDRKSDIAWGEGGVTTARTGITISGITVEVTLPAGATAGTACTGTVTVKEGTEIKATYAGTLTFTSATDNTALLPDPLDMTGKNGTSEFSVTFKKAGNQTVTATDTANGYTGTSGAVAVTAGTATKIRVETKNDGTGVVVPAQNLASASTLTVYSITRDDNDNFVANAAATWSFASKTGGVLDGDLAAAGDFKSAVMTGGVIGTGVIRATSGTLTKTDSGTITVIVGPATKVRVETAADGSGTVVAAQNLASGSTLTVYSITRDASNNFVANAASTWSFSSKSAGVADGDLQAAGDGKSAVMTGNVIGTGVIHVVSGDLTPTDSGIITVIAGTATKIRVETAADGSGTVVGVQNLASGSTLTVYSITRDASNNFVANAAATWSFSAKGGGVVDTDLAAATDTKSAVMTGRVIGTGVIHAVSGTLNTTDSGTITVIAGPATKIRVETAVDGSGTVVATQTLVSGSGLTVYSITRDASNNFVANAAATWSFASKTAGVVDGDLVAAGDNKSAVMTGHAAGTGVIRAASGDLTKTDSGTITVVTLNVTLSAGWNIFSTPFTLESGYRTWGELAVLQPDLANAAKVTAIYSYDPTSTTSPWKQVTSAYTMKACDAIYVKVASGTTVTVGLMSDSNEQTVLPQKALYGPAWNLISLGYYTGNIGTSTMDVDVALLPIYKGTGAGDTWGYTQVVSPPSCNQSTVNSANGSFIYMRDATTGVGMVTKPKLVATDGYWVFMVNNGTLAGITVKVP